MKLSRKNQVAMLLWAITFGHLATATAVAQAQKPAAGAQPGETAPHQASPAAPIVRADGASPPFLMQFDGHLTVRADRTGTEITTKRIKILTPVAVQTLSQHQLLFVEGMQKLETLEAYTEKADGRHVAVDPASIITRDAASGLQATYVPDLKQQTIIFPDVAVGDTLVLTNKTEILQSVFPGQFTDFDVFSRSVPLSSAQYTIEAPSSLDLAIKATGNSTTDKVESIDGLQRHTITIVPQPYKPEEAGAVSPFDRDATVIVSTFHSYEELGMAYGKAAFPKIKVTPEIAALADDITKNAIGHRAQTEAIDAWIKQNIRYVALFLSVGRVVPHEAEAILHNKFGDCKDKATLMAALLAAKGIESEAVLINLGNAYTLPEPAAPATLNHVILYLPEFDLYDDPTANWAAFGVLEAQAYDKPVVRVSANAAKLARTPLMRPEDHVAHAMTTIKLGGDGLIAGQTQETNTGFFGTALRSLSGVAQQVGDETLAQRQLQAFNTPGTGHIDFGNLTETRDPAVVKSTFTFNGRFKPPAAGGGAIIPIGLPLTARPGNALFGTRLSGRASAFVCFAATQIEDIEAAFDLALPLPMSLAAINIDNPMFTYRASFKLENRTLKIHRELVSRVQGQVCPAETEAQISADLDTVRNDINRGYRFFSPGKPTDVNESVAITAGHKQRLYFGYTINVDCSAMGFATIATVEAPKHGKITVDHGRGKSNFPASNPRSECNKGEVEGSQIWYEPEPGFSGADAALVEVTNVDGGVARRHYSFNVNPPREASAAVIDPPANAPLPIAAEPTPAKAEQPAAAAIVDIKRVAIADQPLRVAFLYELNPDCSVVGVPAVHFIEQPKNGKVSVENGNGFSNFPASNTRSKCNSSRSDGAVISYTPNPGYIGDDSISTEIIYHDGSSIKRRYAIEVK